MADIAPSHYEDGYRLSLQSTKGTLIFGAFLVGLGVTGHYVYKHYLVKPAPVKVVPKQPTPVTRKKPANSAGVRPNPATIRYTFSLMQVLRIGSTGARVEALQRALWSLGYDPHGVDGSFGANTQVAVMAFQRANGLTADGIVGARTYAALNRVLNRHGGYWRD